MSVNHVERHALACGFSVERIVRDYGIDLILFTYDDQGEIESGQVFLQLKATDHPQVLQRTGRIAFTLKRCDLRSWLAEPMPLVLMVYDAPNDKAYWLYIQAYFADAPGFDPEDVSNTVTVHIPMEQVVGVDAIRAFARFRDEVVGQTEGVLRHHVT
jgi:hypothetical protein